MRLSNDQYVNGKLWNGYDYDKQEWVENGQPVPRQSYAGEGCTKCVKFVSLCEAHAVKF